MVFCAEFEARKSNSKKMAWLMRFMVFFCLSITKMSALNFFPEKFKIGEKHTSVTLTCKTTKDSVTWKREDAHGTVETLDETDYEILSGRDLTVIDLLEDQIGNYTCWSDTGLEDYTYLLLDKSKEATGFTINCTAETFSCTEHIKCTWTSDEFTAFRLRNTRDNGDWVAQSVDGVFFLPHSTNSFSEESERLLITGEAVSSCCYMKTDYSFYLRDIVKPADPKISIIKNEDSDEPIIELEVTPPPSWPQPQSFFPLKHQIEYENRHNGKRETKEWEGSKIQVKGHISKLRVRCRDLLLLSQWSEWTSWKNVPNREKITHTKKHGKEKKCRKKQDKRNKKKNQKKICKGKKKEKSLNYF